MEKKTEKVEKTSFLPKYPIKIEVREDAYRQINRVSFQENFRVLIAHYKTDGQGPRVG